MRKLSTGALTEVRYGGGQSSAMREKYIYDSLDRLMEIQYYNGGETPEKTVSFAYNGDG